MTFYSECDSEWVDCVTENEQYLREQRFYDDCTLIRDGSDTDLRDVTEDTCLENRQCENGQLRDSDEPFVGFNDACTCDVKDPVYSQNYYVTPKTRYKRQTGERYATGSVDTRMLKTPTGGTRFVRDTHQSIRTKRYTEANKIHIDHSNYLDVEGEDPLG